MYGLYNLWYTEYPKSKFHFFDDSGEWLQMDKFGHAYSSYYLSSLVSGGLKWSGLKKNKAVLIGATASFATMTSIEVFDGFSTEWGASITDMVANFSGSALFACQELFFEKQIFRLKFSYYPTTYPSYSPNLLGKNNTEQILKDYNGQTYWLSANLKDITKQKFLPNWLNVAVGYSASGMIRGNVNDFSGIYNFKRYRQYYFSLDADLSKIKTKNKILRSVLRTFNCLKIPFPAINFQQNKFKLKGFYF